VALAEPEADPLYYYTNGLYTYKSHVAPTVKAAAAPIVPTMYYNYYNPYVYTIPAVKAEEPAVEAKADEVVEVKAEEKTVVPAVYTPTVYTVPHVYNPIVPTPVAVKAAPYYYANSAGVVHQVAKREAEAGADADALYYSAYAHPYAYGYPYGYRYGAYGAYGYPYGYRYVF
jgi:hypothetical protein